MPKPLQRRLGAALYACWTRERRVRKIVPAPQRYDELVVTGRRVAWTGPSYCEDEGCDELVQVMDVRTGVVLVRSRVPDRGRGSGLALSPRRGVAWIEKNSATLRVVALTRSGTRIVLADSPDIRRNSLALRANTLYWLLDDEPQTAQMP